MQNYLKITGPPLFFEKVPYGDELAWDLSQKPAFWDGVGTLSRPKHLHNSGYEGRHSAKKERGLGIQ